jgi:hypothetical protein
MGVCQVQSPQTRPYIFGLGFQKILISLSLANLEEATSIKELASFHPEPLFGGGVEWIRERRTPWKPSTDFWRPILTLFFKTGLNLIEGFRQILHYGVHSGLEVLPGFSRFGFEVF